MFETYYGKLQPYFGENIILLNYMDTDSLVLSINSSNIIKDIRNLEDIFDFRNLNKNHEPFSNKNKKVIGKLKTEFAKYVFVVDFFVSEVKFIH